MQVDVDAGIQRRLKVGHLAGAQGIDSAAQQFGIQREADFLNLSALRIAE